MSVRMMMLGGALALLACGAPIRALPAVLDPSNPDGPEGAMPPASVLVNAPSVPASSGTAATEPEPLSPTPAQHHGHGSHDMHGGQDMPKPTSVPEEKPASAMREGTESASSYTCPMHPEVVQSSPGQCPKCGMKLMPQSSPSDKKASPAVPAPKKDEGHGGHTHHMEAAPRGNP